MTIPLIELARVIRSKNAGPFELTLDILFRDRAAYDLVEASGVLDRAHIAALYQLTEDQVLSVHFYPPALAYKATVVRPISSGTVGDSDVFGAQQHAPLLGIVVPSPDTRD